MRRPVVRVALAATLAALAALPASAGAATTPGFLRAPTDQLGVPGAVEGAELTPEGSLFTGRLELAARIGTGMRRWEQRHRVLEGRSPVYRGTLEREGLRYDLRTFAVDAQGVPVVHVRFQVRNDGRRERRYGLGLDVGWLGADVGEEPPFPGAAPQPRYRFPRPVVPERPGLLDQPGDAFDPTWTYAWSGGTLSRSGRPLLAVADGGRRRGEGRRSATAAAPVARSVGATRRWRGTLAPGRSRTVDVVVPLRAVPAGSPVLADRFSAGLQRLRAAWQPVLGRAMDLDTPEPLVDRAWRAGLLHLLVPRHRVEIDGTEAWVQTVNKLQYQAFWIRDTAMIAHALDLLGLHEEARQDVAFLPTWQEPSGLLRSRVGQFDGMGQALWSFGDHLRRAPDPAFARSLLPVVERAMGWVAQRLRDDPRWILPASDPRDNEAVAGHATGDLAWLVGGTRAAVGVARQAGDAERAASWSAIADQVAGIATARFREAARGDVVPPVLDAAGGQRWGEMWLAWPTGALAPADPLVRGTMHAAALAEREGLAIWDKRLHLYLGLRRRHTELLAGRRDVAISGAYAVIAHLTSTGGTWEQGSKPGGPRDARWALGPHAWAAADLISLLRDMLVREDGDGIRLLDAIPPTWLRPGAVTRIRRAATEHGPVDLELRARSDGAVLRWSAPAGVPLRLRVPAGVSGVRIPGAAPGAVEVALPSASGTLRLRWRPGARIRDARDAREVRDRLRRSYARIGRPW